MARKKITIAFVQKMSERKACYNKRKNSIFRKANELSVLCGIDVSVIVNNPFDQSLETWPPSKDQADKVIERYVKHVGLKTTYMLNQKEYAEKQLKKSKKNLKMLQRINKLEEMDMIMDAYFVEGEGILNQIKNKADIHDFECALNVKFDNVCVRIEEMTNPSPCVDSAPPEPDNQMVPQNQSQSLPPPPPEMPFVNPEQMMQQKQYHSQFEMLCDVAAIHMLQLNLNQNLQPPEMPYNIAGHMVQQNPNPNQNLPFAYNGNSLGGNGNEMVQQPQQVNGGWMPSMFNNDVGAGPSSSHFP